MDLFDVVVAKKLSGSGGGGGASDFSTATITVINNSATEDIRSLRSGTPHIVSVEGLSAIAPDFVYDPILHGTTKAVSVPLYGGYCLWKHYGFSNKGLTVAASGNAVINDDFIVISGDGTVTLEDGGAM